MNSMGNLISSHAMPGMIHEIHHNAFPIRNNCPCALNMQCRPCGIIALPESDLYQETSPLDCPCAPHLNCPMCPPLSLLHEIASKKVSYIVIKAFRRYKTNN